MAPLDRAIAFEQMHEIAFAIAKQLNFHGGFDNGLFEVHGVITKGCTRLAFGP